MVRIVDLGADGSDENLTRECGKDLAVIGNDDRPNPNFDLKSAAALSCYPIISLLASYVDLTTLHELSRTCRQFRENLLQHRKLLIEQTLRCENENKNPALSLGEALNSSVEQWSNYARIGTVDRVPGGKIGACAPDMVRDCRKCGRVVCRNCVIKQPTPNVVKGRFRRLCRTCMKSALEPHTIQTRPTEEYDDVALRSYSKTPCTCNELVWICNPCGQSLRVNDTTYFRGWAWRTRYSACGGIGAGLGEGNEGVECGRDGDCLGAKDVQRELECDADDLAALEAEMEKAEIDGRTWAGNSYMTHEIVGIGGKVKTKILKNVKVGAIVKEYEDERKTGKFLRREQEGANRSWCSWCDRVVLGKKDLDQPTRSTESIASSSSSASSQGCIPPES